MKKLCLIAIMCLLAANVFALEYKFYGYTETNGRWFINNNIADDNADKLGKSRNATFIEVRLRFFGELLIDDNTKIVMRSTPLDLHRYGSAWGSKGHGPVILDRAWIEYKLADGLKITGGRIQANVYTRAGWAAGMIFGNFVKKVPADGSMLSYKVNENTLLWATTFKQSESSTEDMGEYDTTAKGNGKDSDFYGVGGKFNFDKISVNSFIGYNNAYISSASKDRTSLYSVYADMFYNQPKGLNVQLAMGYVGGNNGGTTTGTGGHLITPVKSVDSKGKTKYENMSAYGAYLDVFYKAESYKVGGYATYSSWDKKGGYFSLGGEFDRTEIIDDKLGGNWGVPANTNISLYGEIYPVENLTLGLGLSYYMSNISKSSVKGADYVVPWAGVKFGKDTNLYEVDLRADYQVTKATMLRFCYALAFFNDLYYANGTDSNGNTKYSKTDADPVHAISWQVITGF